MAASLRPRRPAQRLFLWVLAAGFAAAVSERTAHELRAAWTEPSLGAAWIWAANAHRPHGVDAAGRRVSRPIAFFAARDVELDRPPERAWAVIAADESYVLYINGVRVGANVYRRGSAVDRYEVGDLLDAGWNRLLIQLASSRGAGGLLASLRLDHPAEAAVVTDGDWRIFRRHHAALFGGWTVLERIPGGERPQLWPSPPTGRWRVAPPEGTRPIPEALLLGGHPRRPRRLRGLDQGAEWKDLAPDLRRLPPTGPTALFDWGEPVIGYLTLPLDPEETGTALLWLGTGDPPQPGEAPADEIVVPLPGSDRWHAPRPYRFRYLAVVGAALRLPPQVAELPPPIAKQLTPPPPLPGLLGLRSIRSRPRAEEEAVWRRLASGPTGPLL